MRPENGTNLRQIYPNKENHEIYRFYYDKYIKSYFSMKDLMHEISTVSTAIKIPPGLIKFPGGILPFLIKHQVVLPHSLRIKIPNWEHLIGIPLFPITTLMSEVTNSSKDHTNT